MCIAVRSHRMMANDPLYRRKAQLRIERAFAPENAVSIRDWARRYGSIYGAERAQPVATGGK